MPYGVNLLENADFEADISTIPENTWHRCVVLLPDGTFEWRSIGEIHRPPGWWPWFAHHPGVYDQPEGRDTRIDPRRFLDYQAWMMFWRWRNGWGGLFQQLDVVKGSRIEATILAHAWSNGLESGFPDDPHWSDGTLVGSKIVSLRERDLPEHNGDSQNDANSNFRFCVGLHPYGGLDPRSQLVVWGEPRWNYNGYLGALPSAVIESAPSHQVTMFACVMTEWPLSHNDAYWDDGSLVMSEVQPPPPERGQPRLQYERKYHLLPPEATLEETQKVVKIAYASKGTVGYSADDAGVGDLDVRRVIAYAPERWPNPLEPFFEAHYPGVEYRTASIPENGPPPPPPTGRLTRGHLGPHIQEPVPGLGEFILAVQPPVVKLVGGFEQAVWIKQNSPNTLVLIRQHVDDQGKFGPMNPWEGATRFLDTHRDALWRVCNELAKTALTPPYLYVEGLNEEYGTDTYDKNILMRDWDLAFGEVLARSGLPVAPVYLNCGVGNPPEGEVEDVLLPLAQDAIRREGLLGYHSYWWMAKDHTSGLHSWWPYHAGRFTELDRLLREFGVAPRWVGTEGGIVWSPDGGYYLNPGAGYWAVCRRELYVKQLMEYDALQRDWNAENDDRYVGTVLFTSGGREKWKLFECDEALWQMLAPRILERYGDA